MQYDTRRILLRGIFAAEIGVSLFLVVAVDVGLSDMGLRRLGSRPELSSEKRAGRLGEHKRHDSCLFFKCRATRPLVRIRTTMRITIWITAVPTLDSLRSFHQESGAKAVADW